MDWKKSCAHIALQQNRKALAPAGCVRTNGHDQHKGEDGRTLRQHWVTHCETSWKGYMCRPGLDASKLSRGGNRRSSVGANSHSFGSTSSGADESMPYLRRDKTHRLAVVEVHRRPQEVLLRHRAERCVKRVRRRAGTRGRARAQRACVADGAVLFVQRLQRCCDALRPYESWVRVGLSAVIICCAWPVYEPGLMAKPTVCFEFPCIERGSTESQRRKSCRRRSHHSACPGWHAQKWRTSLLGARMVMPAPMDGPHHEEPARPAQFAKFRMFWN